MTFRHLLRSVSGFSIAEIATALTVSSIVAGAAVPSVQDYIRQARQERAVSDVHTIATALARLEGDVLGQSTRQHGWATFDILVSPGEAPAVGTGGDKAWTQPAGTKVGLLDDQLVTNAAGYTTNPPRQTTWIRGWHGPYIENGIPVDPWGNRYAVNIRALADGTSCTIVISAGPNGQIETPFTGVAITPGGDDVVALMSTVR